MVISAAAPAVRDFVHRAAGSFPCAFRTSIRARGGLMVCNIDSYAYACGFESGLEHYAYGTFAKCYLLSFVLSRGNV